MLKFKLSYLLPWPRRENRQKAIEEARQKHRNAEADKIETRDQLAELKKMIYTENHFASLVAQQVVERNRLE